MTDTARLLADLVTLPSVNPMGRPLAGGEFLEGRVTAYLESFFRDLGVPHERQAVAPGRDNIVARWPARPSRRTLLFEAHQDTVPVDQMTIPPFGARIENGRLFGRGACDVKGGLAAMLAAFARVVRERPAEAAGLVMACSVDEEHTGLGVQELVRRGVGADLAVVAEPTGLEIVNAHKGLVRWHLITRGRSCHSSRPEEGVNAIYRMAGLLVAVEQYAEWLRTSPADTVLGPPTLSVGRIEGGSSVNTVPDFCRVEIDRRLIPGEDASAAPGQLAAYLNRGVGVAIPFEFSNPWACAPALGRDGSGGLVAALARAVDAVAGQHRVSAVPYCTDAGPIAAAGVPAVVFGPGDIAQAHTCDEWISLAQVEQAAEILYRLACSA
jgi:acetylornithine deacetylase